MLNVTEEKVVGRMLEVHDDEACSTCLTLTIDNLKRGRIMAKMGKRIHRLRVENRRLKQQTKVLTADLITMINAGEEDEKAAGEAKDD